MLSLQEPKQSFDRFFERPLRSVWLTVLVDTPRNITGVSGGSALFEWDVTHPVVAMMRFLLRDAVGEVDEANSVAVAFEQRCVVGTASPHQADVELHPSKPVAPTCRISARMLESSVRRVYNWIAVRVVTERVCPGS